MIAEELNEKNADLTKCAEKILNAPKVSKLVNGHILNLRLKDGRQMLDSLHASPFIRDICLSNMVYDEIDNSRTALSPAITDTLKAMPAQRFYLANARVWASNSTPEYTAELVNSDVHSPNRIRVMAALPMIDTWYEAFSIRPADTMFVPKKKRALVW